MFWNIQKTDPAESRLISRAGRPKEDELNYCERRIAEEERLARTAGSWEAGLIHDQTAMLYRAQLATLRRQLA